MFNFIESRYPGLIQFLRVKLQSDLESEEASDRHFYLWKVNNVVECIDRTRTKVKDDDWTPRPNGTLQTRHPLWLRREAILDQGIFVIEGDYVTLVVREDVKEAFEAEGFTGLYFCQEMNVSDDQPLSTPTVRAS